MREAPPRAQDLDVHDPRTVETGLAALAGALGLQPGELSRLADLLLARGTAHFERNPLSFDEALSLSLASDLAAAGCGPADAALAVRLHWPELARVVLQHERARTGDPDRAPTLALVISGALAPPPLVEAAAPDPAEPILGTVIPTDSTLAAVRGLLGDVAWTVGTRRLRRLFGDGHVVLPEVGRASDMPRGKDFLGEGPYWDRLAAVLHADMPNLSGAKGPLEARRLRRQIDYLLEPPPIDRWKREAGTARVLPRVKHLVEAIADASGLASRARSHPDTLKVIDPDDAVATLRGFLKVLDRNDLH